MAAPPDDRPPASWSAAMTLDSSSLLLRLQALRQQLAASRGLRTAQREASDRADGSAALCAALDAERHAHTMAVTTERLRARVVPADGLGDALASTSELVLRAVRIVVLTELGALRAFVSDSPQEMDLVISAEAELNRITERWHSCRGTAAVDRDRYCTASAGT